MGEGVMGRGVDVGVLLDPAEPFDAEVAEFHVDGFHHANVEGPGNIASGPLTGASRTVANVDGPG